MCNNSVKPNQKPELGRWDEAPAAQNLLTFEKRHYHDLNSYYTS